MKREEMAEWAGREAESWRKQGDEEARERGGGTGLAYATAQHAYLDAIAAELRKTCATCCRFSDRSVPIFDEGDKPTVSWCLAVAVEVPDDGSGFCHRWEGKS